MDEAERCHRIAILDRGVLVADGTPAELTGALAGRSLIVHAAQPRRVQQALATMPGVLSVAQVGNALRVLCDDGHAAIERLRAGLREAGLEAHIEAGTPNLEDVFVASTGQRAKAQAERES
jgi:ABC-2 type transport system ATP-binding protein